MVREAIKNGLFFNEEAVRTINSCVSPFGRLYNSRSGLGAYYRYDPRWLDPPKDKQKACIPHPKIHESVLRRMIFGTDEYAPLSLPSDLRIVVDPSPDRDPLNANAPLPLPLTDDIETFESFQSRVQAELDRIAAAAPGAAQVATDPRQAEEAPKEERNVAKEAEAAAKQEGAAATKGTAAAEKATVATKEAKPGAKEENEGTKPGGDTPAAAPEEAERPEWRLQKPDAHTLDLIWATVWWRKVAYFSIVVVTAVLAVYPFLPESYFSLTEERLLGLQGLASQPASLIADLLSVVLPTMARPWLEALRINPWTMWALVVLVLMLLSWGRYLDPQHSRSGAGRLERQLADPALHVVSGQPGPKGPHALCLRHGIEPIVLRSGSNEQHRPEQGAGGMGHLQLHRLPTRYVRHHVQVFLRCLPQDLLSAPPTVLPPSWSSGSWVPPFGSRAGNMRQHGSDASCTGSACRSQISSANRDG